MNLDSMTQEELELLSYTDLTELILKENNGAMNTAAIFKKISALVSLTDEEYASKIGDFYTSLTTDKRFIFLFGSSAKERPFKTPFISDLYVYPPFLSKISSME